MDKQERKTVAYVKRFGKTDVLFTRYPPKDAIPLVVPRKDGGKEKK